MSYDVGKTPEGFKAVADNRNHLSGIFIGIVMKAADPSQRMGRLKVWIPEFGGDQKNPKYWYTVSYASPFAGATNVEDNTVESGGTTQQSYGLWMVPPDEGNQVLVCFVNGDTARGYWFACIYQQNMNQMVPAAGAAPTLDGTNEPVMEYNKKDRSVDLSNPMRQRFAPLADGLIEQGLADDPRKGIATTSARRDDVSRAFGFITPRGNTIHIDDGEIGNGEPDNEFIRMRTRSGVGITIHETDGFVYIVSKNGKSYVQVGDDGVTMYSENPVALRTTGDYNIQSAGDINIDAGGSLNIFATGRIAMGSGDKIDIAAGSDLVMGSGGDSSIKANSDLLLTSGGLTGMNAGGASLRQGKTIGDGIASKLAPTPEKPERHPMPDGRGGSAIGSSIGSAMPHHEPYSPYNSTGGNEPVDAGPRPTTAQIKKMMQVMYDELRRLGWTDIGAKAMIAQIGRENDFRPFYMFGNHRDPANRYTNSGMLSWQGSRRTKLMEYLKKNGALDANGNIKQEDSSIRKQLQFMDKEMKSDYGRSYNIVRSSTAQYRQVEVTLSTNYVRWARNGGRNFSQSDASRALRKMDGYYATVASLTTSNTSGKA